MFYAESKRNNIQVKLFKKVLCWVTFFWIELLFIFLKLKIIFYLFFISILMLLESTVSVLKMADGAQTLVTLTQDMGLLLGAVHDVKWSETIFSKKKKNAFLFFQNIFFTLPLRLS